MAKMTFGFEIECGGLPTEEKIREVMETVDSIRYGGHFRYKGGNAQYGLRSSERGMGNLWVSENDCSLSGMVGPINRGHEVISPVLEGEAGLQQARQVMKALAKANCKVNKQTALHVHLGVRNTSARFRRMGKASQAQAITRIVDAYDYFMDEGFNALVAASRRPGHPNASSYAKAIVNRNSFGLATKSKAQDVVRHGVGRGVLNIANFQTYGSIEFRQHNGTLNGHKITTWAKLMHRLVSWACTQEHPNFKCDLRNFSPDFYGLMSMLQVNDELLRALVARKDEVNMVPHRANRYAQAYLDFQTGLGQCDDQFEANHSHLTGGWVACGDDFGAPFGVDA